MALGGDGALKLKPLFGDNFVGSLAVASDEAAPAMVEKLGVFPPLPKVNPPAEASPPCLGPLPNVGAPPNPPPTVLLLKLLVPKVGTAVPLVLLVPNVGPAVLLVLLVPNVGVAVLLVLAEIDVVEGVPNVKPPLPNPPLALPKAGAESLATPKVVAESLATPKVGAAVSLVPPPLPNDVEPKLKPPTEVVPLEPKVGAVESVLAEGMPKENAGLEAVSCFFCSFTF